MKRWSEEEENLLALYVSQGKFYSEIANMLGRTRKSIEKKCERLQISNNKRTKVKTTEDYKKELSIKCPTLECLGEYVRGDVSILHKCLRCGEEHLAIPRDKLRGNGHCGRLFNSGLIKDTAIVYLVYLPDYGLYKFGITNKSVKERMKDNKINNYESIVEIPLDSSNEAIELEKLWKANLKNYLVNTGKLHSGNTETFII